MYKELGNSHWQHKYMEYVIKQRNTNNKPIIVETLDPSSSSLNYATHKIDGFNDEAIDKLKNQYDLVFLPDCGGPWFTDFLNLHKVPIPLIKLVLNIVKKEGFLYASKLYNSDAYSIAKKLLLDEGYKTDTEYAMFDTEKQSGTNYLIIEQNK